MTAHRSHGTLDPPLTARNGRSLKVLATCRISTVHQDERSLTDQEALYRQRLTAWTKLPFDMEVLASQGSGECLDRDDYLRAIELVATDTFDLVITEDLARICRRVHAHLFCELCEDHETRLIALNDHVDTGRDDWRLGSFFAVMRHEAYNRDTSQRIRRSQRHRFSQGGAVHTVIYGYEKPSANCSDSALRKLPEAEPIYDEWFGRLENGATYSEIADWLNERGIKPGPYCRNQRWDGPMVARITHNSILKGVRRRNEKMSKRINSTGRRRSMKAPAEELLERHCPHLAFIDAGRYDRLTENLKQRNAKCRRQGENGKDSRSNVPRKRTRWPGQHLFCGICGRMFVFGGNGQTDHLMCSGARDYLCWNSISVDRALAAPKLAAAIFAELESLADFDTAFAQLLEEQMRAANGDRDAAIRQLSSQLAKTERALNNVVQFVCAGDTSLTIRAELERLEREKSQLERQLDEVRCQADSDLLIPSAEELRTLAREAFHDLAIDSFDFCRPMRQLIPKIVIFPYRLCDGGRIVPRAKFRLLPGSLAPDPRARELLQQPLERILSVDLFEPFQREAFREQLLALRRAINPATGKKYTKAAAAREVGITVTAAQRAAALQRRMDELGITDPYLPVLQPPHDYTKLRRHKHKRYSFTPLEGAGEL